MVSNAIQVASFDCLLEKAACPRALKPTTPTADVSTINVTNPITSFLLIFILFHSPIFSHLYFFFRRNTKRYHQIKQENILTLFVGVLVISFERVELSSILYCSIILFTLCTIRLSKFIVKLETIVPLKCLLFKKNDSLNNAVITIKI